MKFLVATAFSMMFMCIAAWAHSAEVPFDQARFDAARAAGKPVAVVFHAGWCPTCRAQAPVLKDLAQMPDFKSLTLYVADFDTEKALKKALHVTQQSTIVVFKNGNEIARSTGDTQKDSLTDLLQRAVP